MVKRLLSLILGFGLITAGVAGIATTLVDQKNAAALKEVESAREQIQMAAAEERRKQEEKQRETDELARTLKEEKQRLEEERRSTEQIRRSAEAMIREQKRAAREPAPAPGPAKEKAAGRRSESEKEQAALSKERRKPDSEPSSSEGSRRSPTAKAPKSGKEDETFGRIARKAGMEAARLSEPVQYYNRYTRERVLAEPLDYGRDSVRVRIRVWRNDRLVKDKVVSFPETSAGSVGRISA